MLIAPLIAAQSLTTWDNIVLIVSKPDNIPIVIMLVLVSFYTWMGMRDAAKNDRLIAQGRKAEILKYMQD